MLDSCKQWFVGCCFGMLKSNPEKVSYILPFSSISLVNWMLVLCLFKCSWNSLMGRNIPVFVGLGVFFVLQQVDLESFWIVL